MEYFGKILCISANDLTYDDRPVIVNGQPDYSHSRVLDGRDPSTLPAEILAPIMSVPNYKKLASKGGINVVRKGGGLGSYALIEVATLPVRFRERIQEKYGEMKVDILRDWFAQHYVMDAKARAFYTRFRFDNGEALPPEHINEYTVNASVLQAVIALLNDTKILRKAMQGGGVNWSEMAGAISYYQAEFGHTLPLSTNRFKARVNEFRESGYECLISKKFQNQNKRKVTYTIERLVLSLAAQEQRPYATVVMEMYNQFLCGELEVTDLETGEIYNPEEFVDKKGNPIVLSEGTIANILNDHKNKALLSKVHDSSWDFNNRYRPYHLRKVATFAGSKISLDDRDLPRPMHNGQRVKAYYAYDVASGAVVGYAYSRLKTKELFIDCMRNMFQTLDRNGLYMPAELEVEHHLVSNFADGLMNAGTVFPLIRWCNPGNSREKRAEHFNRTKKYSVEKRLQTNIGRWYAKLEANRPKEEKVYDELNNTYKVRTYSYEELVADDIRAIQEYNSQLHPNDKKYPGMTRWDVFCQTQNPDLAAWDRHVLYRYIGECTETSIRQNMYCTVQYQQFRLPSPDVIEKLAPRNNKVLAYYLPDIDGNISEVYIYQNDKFIATCALLERYNEATAEQTDADREAYIEQSKYVAQFDSMMRQGKIQKVAVVSKKDAQEMAQMEVKPVVIPIEQDDEDYSEYMDTESVKKRARASV